MICNFPVGSIMWTLSPNTAVYMPYRMKVLHRLWKYENGAKTQLIETRWSADGGTHGDNNHPAGSKLDLPLGSYCWELFNFSENQVPIQQIIIRGDSNNTNSLWGLAPDLGGHACHKTVKSGERGEIVFNIENFTGSQYYHFDCNAWFVDAELNFSVNAIPTFGVDWGLNPLRVTVQEGVLYFYNTITQNPNVTYLPNSQYFQGTSILNPYFTTTGSGTGGVGNSTVNNYTVSTNPNMTPNKKKNTTSNYKKIGVGLGILLFLKSLKDGYNN